MPENPIGRTKGPGETPHEFTVVAPDPQQRVRYGDYCYYCAHIDGRDRAILGRVTQRSLLRALPDSFAANPSIPPQQIADLLG
ncbi:MAG: ATP-binding protein, partial [Chloroflexi bacterium]|nr:ATP-binding protein [Chloroflexota bacterium]